jgi:hypothetical protein
MYVGFSGDSTHNMGISVKVTLLYMYMIVQQVWQQIKNPVGFDVLCLFSIWAIFPVREPL